MHEPKYEEAINALKEKYPQYKKLDFDISDGELQWIMDSRYPVYDSHKLQKFVNDFLGQKVYRAEYIGHIDVYARSKEEAKEFVYRKRGKINHIQVEVNVTDSERISF